MFTVLLVTSFELMWNKSYMSMPHLGFKEVKESLKRKIIQMQYERVTIWKLYTWCDDADDNDHPKS